MFYQTIWLPRPLVAYLRNWQANCTENNNILCMGRYFSAPLAAQECQNTADRFVWKLCDVSKQAAGKERNKTSHQKMVSSRVILHCKHRSDTGNTFTAASPCENLPVVLLLVIPLNTVVIICTTCFKDCIFSHKAYLWAMHDSHKR
jgi:hypothetical protein